MNLQILIYNVNINFIECCGIISALSNNWNQIIMGETIKLDINIVVNIKTESKSCKYSFTNDLFRGFGKSLLIVTTKWEYALETTVEGWHERRA